MIDKCTIGCLQGALVHDGAFKGREGKGVRYHGHAILLASRCHY